MDTAPSAYAVPTPQVLYIHDDLTREVYRTHREHSKASQLTRALFALVRRDAPHVVILRLDDQLTRLVAQEQHTPFSLTIGIGQTGERLARELHVITGWFPTIRRVDVTREEEDSTGGYKLVSLGTQPLADQLQDIAAYAPLAVVDDTVFSGLTMRTVLQALPSVALARARAFCMRGVAEALVNLRDLCPLGVGFAAPGRILDEVSFINAAGLVRRISIRRAGQPPLAFFDRPEWMHAWFPVHAEEVTELCRRLNALLEPLAETGSSIGLERSDPSPREECV
jgi:hypothetical protein